ncbi:hypothetical protein [Cupriavidus sp. amp6]|uniref:hypothetical protein n=1 Tax=Cupriavidus sp. amp6 TaxID=388051 RepID=UPI00048D5C7E|nr:hypothetical protein [Cupriavidus sp. amp6]
MLRVRIELVPNGDEAASRLLGDLEIINDGTGTEFTGNYDVVMKEYSESASGKRTAFQTTAIIEDVERDIARPVQLVGLAMSLLAPVKRTLSNNFTPWGRIVSQKALDD